MCTVTLIPIHRAHGVGFRLIFSRDEQRERPDAVAPAWRRLADGTRAIWPTDAKAGGTWIAGCESGLTLCLLNSNLEPAPAMPPSALLASRGEIIPALVALPGVDAALSALSGMDLGRFAPFRLLAIEPVRGIASTDPGRRALLASWDRESLRVVEVGSGPLCLASSGLGDSKVLPRLALFRDLVMRAGSTSAAQDRFHRHAWPAMPEISVLMARSDARTVSITTVEVAPQTGEGWNVDMAYMTVREASTEQRESARRAVGMVVDVDAFGEGVRSGVLRAPGE
jgi:hypothetical protein